MKYALILLIALFAAFSCGTDSKKTTKPERTEKKTPSAKSKTKKDQKTDNSKVKLDKDWVAKKGELNLTDDQLKLLSEIEKDFNKKRRAITGNDSLSETKKKADLKELKKLKRKQIKVVLNSEQQKKWNDLKG